MTLPKSTSILSRNFLASKVEKLNPKPIVSVQNEHDLPVAIEILKSNAFGSLVVRNLADQIVGILTERDLILKLNIQEISINKLLVKDLMTANPESIKSNASIARAIFAMMQGGYRHLPVQYLGASEFRMISIRDVVDYIYLRLTKKIAASEIPLVSDQNLVDSFFQSSVDILRPGKAVSLKSTASVYDAASALRKSSSGAVLVMERQSLSGIFTERDFLTKCIIDGFKLTEIPVTKFMTANPIVISRKASVADAFNLMSEGGYRHIPVLSESNEVVGILSARNFMQYLSDSITKELAVS